MMLRKEAARLAREKGMADECMLLDRVAALSGELLEKAKGRKVAPNVDFYSGFIYQLLGIPTELFTPIFAMARMAGWSAHRIEQIIQAKLIRPAYLSSIEQRNEYVPFKERR